MIKTTLLLLPCSEDDLRLLLSKLPRDYRCSTNNSLIKNDLPTEIILKVTYIVS